MSHHVQKGCPDCRRIYDDDSEFCEEDGQELVVLEEEPRRPPNLAWVALAAAVVLLGFGFYFVPRYIAAAMSEEIEVTIDTKRQWKDGREAKLPLQITNKSSHSFRLESASYKVDLLGTEVTPQAKHELGVVVSGNSTYPFSVPLKARLGDLQKKLSRSKGEDSEAAVSLACSFWGHRWGKQATIGPDIITVPLVQAQLGLTPPPPEVATATPPGSGKGTGGKYGGGKTQPPQSPPVTVIDDLRPLKLEETEPKGAEQPRKIRRNRE